MRLNEIALALEALGVWKKIKEAKDKVSTSVSNVTQIVGKWGQITGNITEQTDLQNILDTKLDTDQQDEIKRYTFFMS